MSVQRSLTFFALLAILPGWLAGCAEAPEAQQSSMPAQSLNAPAQPVAGALPTLEPELVARGKELFETYCQACHGPNAEGERPDEPGATDANGNFFAPALNGSMHGWHHTDEALVTMILRGSARNPRMVAWSEQGLTESDALAIVTYLKSLWGPVQRLCQGPGHMDMNCIRRAQAAFDQ